MLFYGTKQNRSYITTQQILDKINMAFGREIATLREEDGESDALIDGRRVELKQRQNYYITKVLQQKCTPYEKTTIHRSATTHNSDIYIIYDLGMDSFQIFVDKDINPYDSSYDRVEDTDVGLYDIKYSTVDTAKTRFGNLSNSKKTRNAINWALNKTPKNCSC